jgi:hypothetical protein
VLDQWTNEMGGPPAPPRPRRLRQSPPGDEQPPLV